MYATSMGSAPLVFTEKQKTHSRRDVLIGKQARTNMVSFVLFSERFVLTFSYLLRYKDISRVQLTLFLIDKKTYRYSRFYHAMIEIQQGDCSIIT